MTSPTQPPAPIVWRLAADPDRIDEAARAWTAYAERADEAAGDIDAGATKAREAGWTGERYQRRRQELTAQMRNGGELAHRASSALLGVASRLRATRHAVATLLEESVPREVAPDGQVTFRPATEADAATVTQHLARVRAALDEDLRAAGRALTDLRTGADGHPGWEGIRPLARMAGGWRPKREVRGPTVVRDGDYALIDTGRGGDSVNVSVRPADRSLIVEVDGAALPPLPQGTRLTLRTGSGRDTVVVADDVPGVTVIAGSGDDSVRTGRGDDIILGLGGQDTIYAGAGADRVSGGARRDYLDGGFGDDVIDGGAGHDTIYGLSGDDVVSGGEGTDYLDSGSGDDIVVGGAGRDMLSGGRGADTLIGGGGDDRMYGGFDRDVASGGTGVDTHYGQADDSGDAEHEVPAPLHAMAAAGTIDGHITITGTPEFQERVRSDLETLAASPTGAALLEALAARAAAQGHTLRIEELTPEEAQRLAARHPQPLGDPMENAYTTWSPKQRHPGDPGQATIYYNPAWDTLHDSPPMVLLYHELGHVYGFYHDTPSALATVSGGTSALNRFEDVTIGLRRDHGHPDEFTENALRRELGEQRRPRHAWS